MTLRKPRNATGLIFHFAVSVAITFFSPAVVADESYSPYAGKDYPTRAYWGDTHLHTNLSFDAYFSGDAIPPAVAYRFARGGAVTATNGMRARLRRPLDFLVVADHAEALGLPAAFEAKDRVLLETDAGRRLSPLFEKVVGKPPMHPQRREILMSIANEFFYTRKRPALSEAFTRSVWDRVTAVADQHNDPGRFTAFIGYEWSSTGRGNLGPGQWGNLHRVVIFADGAEKAKQVLPFSAQDSQDPEALWDYLASYEKRTGGQVLAIPHNGNLSNGEMFSMQNFAGKALSRSYAERRSRWEPLYETTQIKGDSETHPFLSPTDEFADYERLNSWAGKELPAGRTWNEKERAIKEGEYVRSALKRGLELQSELGANPFKFGMIGSTDAHTSLSAVDENNFWGKMSTSEPSPERLTKEPWPDAKPLMDWQFASSGYAAVWATENTREALFAAMRRKETYATTGSRMTVRFFGGWDYSSDDALKPDLARNGYRKGVPMGGDLTNAPPGRAPRFLIHAVKDPDGANLDRLQVIKGWRDAQGRLHERIYNVALSDGRMEAPDGKAPPVGSTVDVSNATYTNSIGDPELSTMWIDHDFDPKQLAVYYVRVLEIPTPRWTAYDAKFFGIKNISAEIPMVTQERAYTSAIWYTP